MTYLKNSTKKSLFAPNFSCTNLQSKEEAKKSATELLAVTVGHEIFTDTSECAIIMANNIVCKEVILRLSHKIPFYGGHLEKHQIKTSHMDILYVKLSTEEWNLLIFNKTKFGHISDKKQK